MEIGWNVEARQREVRFVVKQSDHKNANAIKLEQDSQPQKAEQCCFTNCNAHIKTFDPCVA